MIPAPVKLAAGLLLASLVPGWLIGQSGAAATVRLVSAIIVGGLVAGVLLRRGWCRIVLLVLVAVGVAGLGDALLKGRSPSVTLLAITAAQLLATLLLFAPAATAWFRKTPGA